MGCAHRCIGVCTDVLGCAQRCIGVCTQLDVSLFCIEVCTKTNVYSQTSRCIIQGVHKDVLRCTDRCIEVHIDVLRCTDRRIEVYTQMYSGVQTDVLRCAHRCTQVCTKMYSGVHPDVLRCTQRCTQVYRQTNFSSDLSKNVRGEIRLNQKSKSPFVWSV